MNKWFGITVLLVMCACSESEQPANNTVDEKIALIRTDRAFSDMSVAKGMKAAFIEYIDSNGVLLKPNHLPIVGANAIDYLIAQDDSGYTLNWQPQYAFVSRSGDLGYTYGVYALHPNNIDTVLYGTYVSIWKKQGDGSWKFVLDSGNEGVDSSEIVF
jgi:ketosteroid isomerase-like protein